MKIRSRRNSDLPRVRVSNEQELLAFSEDAVPSLVEFVLGQEGAEGGVEITLVDDEAISRIHSEFLGVDGPTDVITFPIDAEDKPGEDGFPATPSGGSDGDEDLDPGFSAHAGPRLLGEIIVSTETAIRQAPDFLQDPQKEALLYVVHGVLHLLGYDDQDPASRERMEQRQAELLQSWLRGESEA